MPMITAAEFSTLGAIAGREALSGVPRSHLEKFARLDLIEPCPQGVCMTLKGQRILSDNK